MKIAIASATTTVGSSLFTALQTVGVSPASVAVAAAPSSAASLAVQLPTASPTVEAMGALLPKFVASAASAPGVPAAVAPPTAMPPPPAVAAPSSGGLLGNKGVFGVVIAVIVMGSLAIVALAAAAVFLCAHSCCVLAWHALSVGGSLHAVLSAHLCACAAL